MPNYDYKCEKCKKGFEVFQSMKDDPFKICPKDSCCMKTWGKGKVVRQMGTGAGIIFKGSGFYTTDYRSESYKTAAKSDSASSTAPATPAASPAPATPPPAAKPSSGSGKGKKKAE